MESIRYELGRHTKTLERGESVTVDITALVWEHWEEMRFTSGSWDECNAVSGHLWSLVEEFGFEDYEFAWDSNLNQSAGVVQHRFEATFEGFTPPPEDEDGEGEEEEHDEEEQE